MPLNNLFTLVKNFVHRINLCKNRNFLNNYEVSQILTPNYWSYKNQFMKLKLLIGQLKLISNKPSETKYNDYMSMQPYGADKFLKLIEFSGAWNNITEEQKQNILLVSKFYNSKIFSFEQEGLFGQAFLNGQNPYALQKIKYDPNNQYQKQILFNFNKANSDQITNNGLDFGFNLNNLQSQISKSNPQLYILNFDQLRRLFQNRDQPIQNPNTYVPITYTQIPYAIFTNAKFEGKIRFVCLCAAFKYTKQNNILVVSPYLKTVPYQLWNIACMHIALPHLNDFAVRIHLGRIHMGTSQFNVPFYNMYKQYIGNHTIRQFLNHTYLPFSRGLQGINLNTTSILIPPKNSTIQQRIFTRTEAVNLMVNDLQSFTYNTYSPDQLIKKQGIEKLAVKGSAIYFNQQLYKIISEFIDSLYHHFNMENHEKLILDEIRNQIKNPIPIVSLNLLIKNLTYTWVINHAHTKAGTSFPLYYKYRPVILVKALPNNILNLSFDDLILDSYLPNYESQISSIALALSIAVNDTENFFLQRLVQKERFQLDHTVRQIYKKAIKSLHDLQAELKIVNEERFLDGKFKITWLKPSRMQMSTNI